MDGETADPTEEDNDLDDGLADMQEEEIQRKVEEMRSWASLLHELADQIDYNAAYADQRVYDLIAHTIAPSIQLRNKVREKEMLRILRKVPTLQLGPRPLREL
jgi:hypothetical protein